MNIVFASHTYMGSTFVVGSHHLAKAMAKKGHNVAHIAAPLSLLHLLKWKDLDTKRRMDIWRRNGVRRYGVMDYVPMGTLPWQVITKLGLPYESYSKTFPSIGNYLEKHLGMSHVDLLLMDEPRFVGLEKQLKPKKFVYRATDLYAEMRGDNTIREAEKQIASRADLMIGTSSPVVEYLHTLNPGFPVHLIENGVDLDIFGTKQQEPNDLAKIPHPRAIYVGALDERFDFQAVEKLAMSLPEINIVLIGPLTAAIEQRYAQCGNIHLIGAKPFEQVPAYLQYSDIALLPLSNHPANRGRSPMKIYEYGACGLPVVATAAKELVRRNLGFVFPYTTYQEMIASTKTLIAGERGDLRGLAKNESSSFDWAGISNRLVDIANCV